MSKYRNIPVLPPLHQNITIKKRQNISEQFHEKSGISKNYQNISTNLLSLKLRFFLAFKRPVFQKRKGGENFIIEFVFRFFPLV